MNFGRAIKEIRIKRGLSQSELASATGLTQPYISAIESGDKMPSHKSIQCISDCFRVPPSFIYLASIQGDNKIDEDYLKVIDQLKTLVYSQFDT